MARRSGFSDRGEAVVAWTQFGESDTSVVQAATRPPRGPWSSPNTLSAPQWMLSTPRLVVGGGGDAVVLWYGRFGPAAQIVTRPAGGEWSSPRPFVGGIGYPATLPQVALSARGDGVAVWQDNFGRTVETAIQPPGGEWSPAGSFGPTPETANQAPWVGVSRSGDAVAVWRRYTLADGNVVQAATRPARGVWSAPSTLSTPPGSAGDPQVAVGRNGDAVAVWPYFAGGSVVQAATRPVCGEWSPPTTLSATDGSSSSPQVAVDGSGDAVVAWRRYTGSTSLIEAVTTR